MDDIAFEMGPDDNGVHADAEASVARAQRGSGMALPPLLRSRFESALGADLGQVRIHTGGDAAAAAKSVSASAFTLGQDIFMGAGRYAPEAPGGEELLAHEVAHTVQQSSFGGRRIQHELEVSTPGDALEREADGAAAAMVRGEPASVSPSGGLARQLVCREDEALETTTHRAKSAVEEEMDRDWKYGSEDYDPPSQPSYVWVDGVPEEDQSAERFEQALAEVDRVRPLVLAWRSAASSVQAIAGGQGIEIECPEYYRQGVEAIYETRQYMGSTNSNKSNASAKIAELWKGDDLVKYEVAKTKAAGATSDVQACLGDIEKARGALAVASLDEEVQQDKAKLAQINAAVAQIAGVLGSLIKLVGDVSTMGATTAASATATATAKAAYGHAPQNFLSQAVIAIRFEKEIGQINARIAGAEAQIHALQLSGLSIDLSNARARLAAAHATMRAFVLEVQAFEAEFQQRMQDIGRKYDRMHIDDSTPEGKNELETKGPGIGEGQMDSMEAVMGVFAALQRRGAARHAFRNTLDECPNVGFLSSRVPPEDEIEAMRKHIKSMEDGTHTIDGKPMGALPSHVKMLAEWESLRSTASFVEDMVGELNSYDEEDTAVEQRWAAMVTGAMAGAPAE